MAKKDYDNCVPDMSIDRDVEVEIEIELIVKRTVKVTVNDYTLTEGRSDDGDLESDIDYSSCDWDDALERADVLPKDWEIVDQTVYYP